MSFSDTSSVRSFASNISVVSQQGLTGKTAVIADGTVTQTGLFGSVRHYKAGSVVHGGFFSKTRYVPDGVNGSPYVTPTSSPSDSATMGAIPPEMHLLQKKM
jgi:hypothetical protein